MKRLSIDKSSVFLLVIIAILLGSIAFIFLSLRSDAVDQAMKTDRIINVAFILEREGKPTSTQLFMFYPSNGRGALLDVPGETGLIIKSLNRVDRIDVLYDRRRPKAYVDEVARLLDASIPYWVVIDDKGLARCVDLLEGFDVFVPSKIELEEPVEASLPSGALTLDGDKAIQFAYYVDSDESDSDAIARRQKVLQSFMRKIGEKSTYLARRDVFSAFKRGLRTNLNDDTLKGMLIGLSKLDTDRLVLQRINGAYRNVDEKRLLFPHYDGELVRDIVKQTLNALASSGSSSPADKIFTLEILNGTPTKGLAKKAAEIFQSFGYDVVSVDNAERDDYDKTQILEHFASGEALKGIADVIRCKTTAQQASSPAGSQGGAAADFTVILGKDFNGRYCGN